MLNEDRLIVALDVNSLETAEGIVRRVSPPVKTFKVGGTLFTASGSASAAMVKANGCGVFLDLKLHDIPSTVEKVAAEISRMGVKMFSVHSSGGSEMMKAALRGASAAENPPLMLAVTVLTHLEEETLSGELGVSRPLSEHVIELAKLAVDSGAGGIICSPLEISALRRIFGDKIVIVTPGVRPLSSRKNDQQRILTPGEAIKEGADYIVVGRPILESSDMQGAVRDILDEMEG